MRRDKWFVRYWNELQKEPKQLRLGFYRHTEPHTTLIQILGSEKWYRRHCGCGMTCDFHSTSAHGNQRWMAERYGFGLSITKCLLPPLRLPPFIFHRIPFVHFFLRCSSLRRPSEIRLFGTAIKVKHKVIYNTAVLRARACNVRKRWPICVGFPSTWTTRSCSCSWSIGASTKKASLAPKC